MSRTGIVFIGVMSFLMIVGIFSGLRHNTVPVIKPVDTNRVEEQYQEPKETFSDKNVKIHDLNINKGHVVFLTTEVNANTADVVIQQIKEANRSFPEKPVYLFLDSPGGSVIDGARIISAMQSSKVPVYTVCMQICASMAAMILEYGNERYAFDRSIIMFHPASIGSIVEGELDKIVSRFQFLQRYVNKMDRFTAKRAGIAYDDFKARSNRELWIDAEDALHDKLIDKIVRADVTIPETIQFGSNKAREKVNLKW